MAKQTTLRTLEVSGPQMPGKPSGIHEHAVSFVEGDGDQAKATALMQLQARGYVVRSINWSPSPGTMDPVLLAYIEPRKDPAHAS